MKLLITLIATIILLIHTQPIDLLAHVAAKSGVFSSDVSEQRILMLVASGAALLVLLVLTGLSVYKPKGMTPYGWRRQRQQRGMPPSVDAGI